MRIETTSDVINKLVAEKSMSVNSTTLLPYESNALDINTYVCLSSGSQSVLARYTKDTLCLIKPVDIQSIKPCNLEQKFLSHALYDDQLTMLTVTGPAGTGKTLLVLAAALDQTFTKNKYEQIILTKPRLQVTDDSDEPMGELPGDVSEKMAPMMLSYESAVARIWGVNYKMLWQQMISAGKIKVIPLEFMRGIDLAGALVICDEAQNVSRAQYKTLATRLASDSRLICLGDMDQIDKKRNIGTVPLLEVITHKLYKASIITSHIALTQVERGPLTDLMVKIFKGT